MSPKRPPSLDERIKGVFFQSYHHLFQQGKITAEQLEKVGLLLENLENRYKTADLLQQRLEEIFNKDN